jgi:hypothetical protein
MIKNKQILYGLDFVIIKYLNLHQNFINKKLKYIKIIMIMMISIKININTKNINNSINIRNN